MASSSLVGTHSSATVLSEVEITRSSPRTVFFSGSSWAPRYPNYFAISARPAILFSPTPAVNAIASTPFIAAAYAPMYFATL